MYKVYVQTTNDNKIYNINSSPFIADLTNWIEIDEGVGEKYLYAQQAYLPNNLYDDNDILRYSYINEEIIERSEEDRLEEAKDRYPQEPSNDGDLNARVAELEAQLAAYEAAYAQGVNEA